MLGSHNDDDDDDNDDDDSDKDDKPSEKHHPWSKDMTLIVKRLHYVTVFRVTLSDHYLNKKITYSD